MRNSIISSNIKELRINKKLSQEDLSEKSGLSLRTIQRLENGESIPRGDTLKMLANALEVSVDYFNNYKHENKQSEVLKKITIIIPWYLIGFIIIFGSIGFILSLVMVVSGITLTEDINLALIYAGTILFIGIGIVVGNAIEKKYRE